MISFILNNELINSGLHPGTVLLDFIRYHKNLKGTKIGCREGDCGACTVLVGELIEGTMRYRSVTSCLMPLGNAAGKHIVTIEGVNLEGLNPAQSAMYEEGATQCGFCTPGFVMSLTGYCVSDKVYSEENAVACMDGNICRCTGYKSIERAGKALNKKLSEQIPQEDRLSALVREKFLPEYFSSIVQRMEMLQEMNKQLRPTATSATIVSGGTDLYVQRHDSMTASEVNLVSVDSKLKGIHRNGSLCIVGGAVTVTDLSESQIINESFPAFREYVKLVSSMPIRNMATLAGNFVNASPIGDFTIFFLALDAVLVLSDGDQTREVPLKDFYKGYKLLDRRPEEYVEKFYFKLPSVNTRFNFEKVSKRTNLDIASVNSAFALELKDGVIMNASLSAGGVGPVPFHLKKASAYLANKTVNAETISETIRIAQSEISPISDVRGSDGYKRLLLTQQIKSHFLKTSSEVTEEMLLSISSTN